jgi:hypothetical protein
LHHGWADGHVGHPAKAGQVRQPAFQIPVFKKQARGFHRGLFSFPQNAVQPKSAVSIAAKRRKRHKTKRLHGIGRAAGLHPEGEGKLPFQNVKSSSLFAPFVRFCGQFIAAFRFNQGSTRMDTDTQPLQEISGLPGG